MRGGDGGKRDHPGNGREVAVAFFGVEVGADENEAVHRYAELRLEIVGDAWAAISAVAFAHEVLLVEQAVVLDEPLVDDEREVLDVGRWSVEEFFGFRGIGEGLGEAGADGVDEDEIGEVEPGAGVVGEGCGVGGGVAGVGEGDVLGSDGAEVEVDGGCTGATVDCEEDGAVGFGLGVVEGVGGVHDVAGGLAGGVLEVDGADGGGVVQDFSVDRDGLGDGLVVWEALGWGGGLGVGGRLGGGRRARRAGRRPEGRRGGARGLGGAGS